MTTKTKTVSFARKLRLLGACAEAIEWVGGRTAQRAWDECENPDWMFWLLENTMPPKASLAMRRRIVLLACDCARPALQYGPPGEDRPRMAIELAEKWADGGEVSQVDLKAAGAAAWAAGAAAWAAAGAAGAAARAAAWAAGAAARAAGAAAWAAGAAGAAARAAARAEQCRIIRKRFPKCPAPTKPS